MRFVSFLIAFATLLLTFQEAQAIVVSPFSLLNSVQSAWDQLGEKVENVAQTATIQNRDFWSDAIALGSSLEKYGEELLHNVSSQLPSGAGVIRFKAAMQATVTSSHGLRDVLQASAGAHAGDTNLELFSAELGEELQVLLNKLQEAFPPPDHAPHHEERKATVHKVLEDVEQALVKMAVKYQVPEDTIRSHFDNVKIHLEDAIVTIGDLVEEHPYITEALLVYGVSIMLPEAWLARRLLGLFGFGAEGPIKGSAAAWAQRTFFGAAVSKNSWFSHLQRAGMKFNFPPGSGKKIIGGIGAGVGIGLGLFKSLLGCG